MSMARLNSWGRHPRFPQRPYPVAWRGEIAEALRMADGSLGTLGFGNGRSYGDSCLAASDSVLLLRPLDRIVAVDWETGCVRAEAGMTLDDLLRLSIPRGWFLPVTPGTKFATLGGAVANDVHGKNHHVRGTFGNHVRRIGLVRTDGPQECTPAERSDLFAATIGGLGLTGIIEWVELQLLPLRSSDVQVTQVRFNSLAEFFELSGEFDGTHEYTVAWIDCAAKGPSAGRGIFMAGNHAERGDLGYATRAPLGVPFVPPFSAINGVSLRAFNWAYYNRQPRGRRDATVSYEPFFYPLDRIENWNRIYGPRGFQQYQCVIPERHGPAAMQEILGAIAAAGTGSFLAVLKRFGAQRSPGMLSFPMPGPTLALDFPERGAQTEQLFDRLDAIVAAAGGRLYPAKDAHMSGALFRRSYPEWERVAALRDPALLSRFWKRVIES